jgi:hypothetical protein
MAEKQYHCFYIEPVGHIYKYAAHDRLEPVLALVKENERGKDPNDYSNVSGLRVIWGSALEFEPATVVETYRIKSATET